MSHLFGIGTMRRTKCLERNFDFWPTGRENWAGRRGRRGTVIRKGYFCAKMGTIYHKNFDSAKFKLEANASKELILDF